VHHNVRKTGTSKVTLTGNNTFGGTLTIEGGEVALNAPAAAIHGAAGITVQSGGAFKLTQGTVAIDRLEIAPAAMFQFNGGLLKVVDVVGNLVNNGGTFAPGASPAVSTVSGSFVQTAGTLQIEIGGTTPGSQFDMLLVGGVAGIGGALDVDLLSGFMPTAGQTFQFLKASNGVAGMFGSTSLPSLAGGLTWQLLYNSGVAALIVAPVGGIGDFLPGDYDENGTVDASDYTVWRNAMPSGDLAADGNFDGQVTEADYFIWKSSFGLTYGGGGAIGGLLSVPEPTSGWLMVFGVVALNWALGQRKNRIPRDRSLAFLDVAINDESGT
jgi:autotransporter-associated beta strand protein